MRAGSALVEPRSGCATSPLRGNADEPILLAGISVRMLAELAVADGYEVVALDHFGDRDLRGLCPGVSLLRDLGRGGGPAALAAAASGLDARSVVYTSSFENHPGLVAALAAERTLLGNPREVLERVRDPGLLADCLRDAGLLFPETVAPNGHATLPGGAGPWLVKPRASGGGHGVRRWNGGVPPPASVVQRWVAGLPCSAAFVADGRRSLLLGICEQLVGRVAFGAEPFRWCGNLTPARAPARERRAMVDQARRIGDRLALSFGLRGLVGLDFVWDGDRIWCLEVNPRPSGSLEVIHAAYAPRIFDAHVRGCAGDLPTFDLEDACVGSQAVGKAIVYATRDVRVGRTDGWHSRGVRDVPHTGDRIGAGHPICTLLSADSTPDRCLRRLEHRAIRLRETLHGAEPLR